MVAGALYHTDVGVVLALLSNMPDKPHSVPKDVTGRTARLGHVFYKKTLGTRSRIDLYLLEDGRSAVDGVSLTMTREVPVIRSTVFDSYELTPQGLEQKFREAVLDPEGKRSSEILIYFVASPEFCETQIPDVHNALWSAAGQLETAAPDGRAPVRIPGEAWEQLRRAITYDVFKYYDHKIAQKAERAEERRQKEMERRSTFDFY